MRLSDRYIFGELLLPFFIGTFSVMMMLIGNTLFALLERIMRDHLPIGYVARLLVLNIPTVLVYTLPVSIALAASLATNRMARDNEITTAFSRVFADSRFWRACQRGQRRFVRPRCAVGVARAA